MKKVELLAPAGSFEKAKIAFLYGADAVYCGTSSLSLRTRADMQDNDLEGKKFIDVYIQGFEYAIVNGIDSPKKFAKEYQAAYYNNGERPSYVAKGEYDDIICKLLANKE